MAVGQAAPAGSSLADSAEVQRQNNRLFALEGLEPRVMLSGDGMAGAVPVSPQTSGCLEPVFAEQFLDKSGAGSSWAESGMVFDPAEVAGDMFEGLGQGCDPESEREVCSTAEGDSLVHPSYGREQGVADTTPRVAEPVAPEALPNAESAVAEAENQEATDSTCFAVEVLNGGIGADRLGCEPASQGPNVGYVGTPLTEQLTETLKVANAPPETVSVGANSSQSDASRRHQVGLASPPDPSIAIVNLESLTLGVGDILTIEIGGPTAGPGSPDPLAGYDQVNVSGSASLNGTLKISLINDYSPEEGDTFDVITSVPPSVTSANSVVCR